MCQPFLQAHPSLYSVFNSYVQKNIEIQVLEAIKNALWQITDLQNRVHIDTIDKLFAQLKFFNPKELQDKKSATYKHNYNCKFMCDNIKTLLYPEDISMINADLILEFLKALMCENNTLNEYDDFDSAC